MDISFWENVWAMLFLTERNSSKHLSYSNDSDCKLSVLQQV